MPAETMPARSPQTVCAAPARIHRQQNDGLSLVSIESKPIAELYLSLTPAKGEAINALAKRLAAELQSRNATVVRQLVFGSTAVAPATLKALRRALDDPDLPITWVEGADCGGNAVAGMQIHAVTGAQLRTVSEHGVVLRVWDDSLATHCTVNSILPDRISAAPPEQALEIF